MSTRSLTISIAESPTIKGLFEKRGMKSSLVRRFIAGVSLREALLVVKDFQDVNIRSALDLLGENVLNVEEATRSTDSYIEIIKQISIFCPDSYVSIKLTALGLTISEDLARENLRRLTDEARQRGGVFIRTDMEGSAYTERTLQIVRDEHRQYQELGTVIQSYLRRSDRDVESMIRENISVRLVKGAYDEPETIAYPKKADVDSAFRRQMLILLERGYRPAIATQDEQLIKVAKQFTTQRSIGADRYEFEMLLGVRRDLQESLVKDGYGVRVYIPFGVDWYPYFTRRLAERPENIAFILGHMLRG